MKAVVLGSWGIGENVLRAALDTSGVDVAAVFTRPRDTESSDPFRNLVVDLAETSRVPLYNVKASAGRDGAGLLKTLAPDVVLSAAHPSLLDREFLAVPKHGAVNLHGSLLPKNRGTSPVNWALIRDEPETGLTMHHIDEGMDTGDVIFQELVPITDTDTPATLSDRIKALAGPMVQRALRNLLEGRPLPRVKQDPDRATYAPRLKGEDLSLDWNQPARAVWSFIRGTSQPGLGALTRTYACELRIWHSLAGPMLSSSRGPGTIVDLDPEFITVACKDDTLRIARSAIETVSGSDDRLAIGTRFESRSK